VLEDENHMVQKQAVQPKIIREQSTAPKSNPLEITSYKGLQTLQIKPYIET
jgi:hypothetical protein